MPKVIADSLLSTAGKETQANDIEMSPPAMMVSLPSLAMLYLIDDSKLTAHCLASCTAISGTNFSTSK
jgi:hypothetical protein